MTLIKLKAISVAQGVLRHSIEKAVARELELENLLDEEARTWLAWRAANRVLKDLAPLGLDN